jgi:cytochrome d ubiquinol oxidase subunit II
LQARARRTARLGLVLVALFMAVVSLWTPLEHAAVAARWFTLPNLFYLAPVPLLTAAALLYGWVSLGRGHIWGPFLAGFALFVLGFAGLAISVWPFAVPYTVAVHQAAAEPNSLAFLLVGAVVILPFVLAYTAHNYWVFRGKTGHDGYH